MHYIDTSVLVSAFTREAATERSQTWLVQSDPNTLAMSGRDGILGGAVGQAPHWGNRCRAAC
jgi:hypothetical protein